MDRTALARRINDVCRLSGEFTLRGGEVASTYFDKYLLEADPELLREIALRASDLIPADIEVLAGLELGGIPLATAMGLATGLPVAFVRKEAKTYGTAKLVEGANIAGRSVLVVEDIITTGGQVAKSTKELRTLGAHVEAALCVIDRSGGDHSALEAVRVRLVALLESAELG
jgi:orotate phosphoribosyltransferase